MSTIRRGVARWALLVGASTAWACADAPTTATAPSADPAASLKAEKFWETLASARWNDRATLLLATQPAPPNGQAWASRMLTYLSLAQYRAAVAASEPALRSQHPSVSAAVARASAVVLGSFYAASPAVVATVQQQLAADRLAPRWPGEKNDDVAAGEAIGLAVAQAVIAQAAQDGYLSRPAPTPAPGGWTGTNPVRSLWGATPFLLEPQDLLLAPPPPGYESPEFRAALDEVYAIVVARTPEQLAVAIEWDKVPPNGPFTAGSWNRIAVALIREHHRKELAAARILAYANVAAFDAQIDCFTTKFTWWLRRPAQVDARIAPYLAFTTPNHPSYPSAHSCISSAFGAVLADAFPSEGRALDALVEEAGMSRIYAGIHYRFDVEAGQDIGRRAAEKALAGSLE